MITLATVEPRGFGGDWMWGVKKRDEFMRHKVFFQSNYKGIFASS